MSCISRRAIPTVYSQPSGAARRRRAYAGRLLKPAYGWLGLFFLAALRAFTQILVAYSALLDEYFRFEAAFRHY
jgi:hypothetical protein